MTLSYLAGFNDDFQQRIHVFWTFNVRNVQVYSFLSILHFRPIYLSFWLLQCSLIICSSERFFVHNCPSLIHLASLTYSWFDKKAFLLQLITIKYLFHNKKFNLYSQNQQHSMHECNLMTLIVHTNTSQKN